MIWWYDFIEITVTHCMWLDVSKHVRNSQRKKCVWNIFDISQQSVWSGMELVYRDSAGFWYIGGNDERCDC